MVRVTSWAPRACSARPVTERWVALNTSWAPAFTSVRTRACSTTAVLVGGFGVLAFSSFQMTSYLGILTALTCTLGLVSELIILPPLLLVTTRKAHYEQLSLVDVPAPR